MAHTEHAATHDDHHAPSGIWRWLSPHPWFSWAVLGSALIIFIVYFLVILFRGSLPRFRIDQPVSVSTTEITGQAPPNTSLAVLDISYNGAVLGLGRSDDSGRFSVPVTGLIEGNRIGLGIGELAPGQSIEEMAEFYFPYRGEGFMNIPNLGIYFDTALVAP